MVARACHVALNLPLTVQSNNVNPSPPPRVHPWLITTAASSPATIALVQNDISGWLAYSPVPASLDNMFVAPGVGAFHLPDLPSE